MKDGVPVAVPSGTLMSFSELGDSDWHLGRVAFSPEDGATPPSFRKVGYPLQTRDTRNFRIELHLLIDAQGIPRDIQPAAGTDPKLAREAQKIVASWRFTPGDRNGQPAGVAATFDLVHGRATAISIRP